MARIRQPFIESRNKLRLAFAAICLSFLAFTASAAAAEFDVSLHDMQNLLRSSEFDALEQRFAAFEQAYAEGKATDRIIERGYAAFAVANPDLEPQLNAWVAAKPKSHRPYLALGFYHRNLGWTYRGGRYGYETSKRRISLMRQHFDVAEKNLTAALERKPDSGVAYAVRINMHMAASQRDAMNRAVRAGMEADPQSFAIRRVYFNALLPWWGGDNQDGSVFSYAHPLAVPPLDGNGPTYPVDLPEAMRQFTQFMERDGAETPALRPLRGLTEYAVAEILRRDGRTLDATRYYKRATTFGDYWFFHLEEGQNFHQMARYRDAISAYNRALELYPDSTSALVRRARSYRELKAYDKALADLDKALSLDPKDPDLLRDKSYTLRDAGRFQEAIEALDDAFIYGKFDDYVWDARGRIYLYSLKDSKRAIPDIKRTTELNPRNQAYWYNYGRALYGVRDCKTVDAYKKYLAVCPRFGNKCRDSNMKFAREVIEYMSHPLHCGS